MTEQIKEPSEHNRMAALQLIARQSVTRLAEILDSKDEAIATARKERIAFASMTERDFSGLQSACRRVYGLMKDGAWHTAQSIIDASGQREGIRRMRELRQIGYVVEQMRPEGSREWSYRLVTA